MNERPSVTRCLAILGAMVVVAAVVVVGVVLGITLFFSEADKSNQDPATGDAPLQVVAVGDGYISGEGATAFFPGTDRPGRNQCRRTSSAHPYLVAPSLEAPDGHDGVQVISVACSGAKTTNVIPFTGLDCRDDWFPDGCPAPQHEYAPNGRFDPAFQVDQVPADADVVLVSIGAGDAHLNDVIALCAGTDDSCRSAVEPWLETLDVTLGWRLVRVYRELQNRAPSARIVALTYPQQVFSDACRSTRLDQDETELLAEDFIPRINDLIESAAGAAGAEVVDLADVFGGHRLCQPERPDGETPEIAANAFQVRPVRGITWKLSTWFHGSFYPTEYGHELIAARLLRKLPLVLEGTPPRPGPASADPAPNFLVGAPGPTPFATDSECGGESVTTRIVARPIQAQIALDDVDARTTACYRSFDSVWRSAESSSAAELTIPLAAHDSNGFSGWHEALYLSDGEWIRLVVVAPSDANAAYLPLARAWLWGWVVVVGGIVLHPVIFVTLVMLAIAGSLMWCTRRPKEAQ